MKTNLYTNVVLTVIAALLAWHAVIKEPALSVHAQALRWSGYRAVVMRPGNIETPKGGLETGSHVSTFSDRLNEAASGDRLMALVPIDEPGGNLLAVFAQESEK